MQNQNFYIFAPIKETNMKAKIHFLAINAKEFSKILAEERHQYLSNLFNYHHWQHRNEFKFIVPDEEPAEIMEILDINMIPYLYTFEFITV